MLVPSGITPRLFALDPGERAWLSPKTERMFTLEDVPPDKHVLFIGIGTGPRTMSTPRTHLVCGAGRATQCCMGRATAGTWGYRGELMTQQRLCGNFTYIPDAPLRSSAPRRGRGLHSGPMGERSAPSALASAPRRRTPTCSCAAP